MEYEGGRRTARGFVGPAGVGQAYPGAQVRAVPTVHTGGFGPLISPRIVLICAMSPTGPWSAIADLIAPASCAGCGAAGGTVCPGCAREWQLPPRAHRPAPCPEGLPPVHAVADYDGSVRSLLAAWKERGRRDVAHVLAPVLADVVVSVASAAGIAGEGELVLVPVPSSRAARRRRGEDAWRRVAVLAAEVITARGQAARVDDCLVVVRQPRDQAGLGARERRGNLSGAFACRRPPERGAVIVDDIVTTGSTLVEAARALGEAGCHDVLAAVLAATRRGRR